MQEFLRKIDAHGHFGKSYLGPESSIEGYLSDAEKLGIVACIASPGPTPEITKEGLLFRPCMWAFKGDELIYLEQVCNLESTVIRESPANVNPYQAVNDSLIAQIDRLVGKVSIYVMPIHHPILDTAEEISRLLISRKTIALKIHGVSTFTGPEDVNSGIIDTLKRRKKPLVVHTDMYKFEITNPIQKAYRLNDPIKWALWARETKIPTLITHGARLSQEAIQLASEVDNVVIGIAPDLLLGSEPERLAIEADSYLNALLEIVPPNKLVFDIDYGWNVSERNQWAKRDWKMTDRLEQTAKKIGLKTRDLEDIYFNNAVSFFNL